MLANTNYAQQERLQLGHVLKPFAMPRLPLRLSYLRLPGPVEDHHLALQSAELARERVRLCVLFSLGGRRVHGV